MGSFTVKHTFDTDIDTFWEKIFFSDAFNEALYRDRLGFPRYEVVEANTDANGVVTRKILVEPKSDAPAVVKKLVGDSMSYFEEGRFDPKTRRYNYRVVPSKLADKINVQGEFWVEPRGDKKVERICTAEVKVNIFGVGKSIEGYLEKTTKEVYEVAAAYTQEHIRKAGL